MKQGRVPITYPSNRCQPVGRHASIFGGQFEDSRQLQWIKNAAVSHSAGDGELAILTEDTLNFIMLSIAHPLWDPNQIFRNPLLKEGDPEWRSALPIKIGSPCGVQALTIDDWPALPIKRLRQVQADSPHWESACFCAVQQKIRWWEALFEGPSCTQTILFRCLCIKYMLQSSN